jgi:hypothetical protein
MYGGGFLVTVMILEDAYKPKDDICNSFIGVYIPLLISLLRSKGIDCEVTQLKGFDKKYSVLGKSKQNLIYAPKIEMSNSAVSFIYCDSVSSVATSFKIASIIRNLRSDNEKEVVFVEQIKENEAYSDFSPMIIDNMKLDENFGFNLYETALKRAMSVADGIVKYFNI